VPIILPAPGLFSTITGCPNLLLKIGASCRAMMSVLPPGANPTIIVIGCVGHAKTFVEEITKIKVNAVFIS
jgi:hypothetical protein